MTETEACPDCGSTDVSYYRENKVPWFCWDCGIRFHDPSYAYEDEE